MPCSEGRPSLTLNQGLQLGGEVGARQPVAGGDACLDEVHVDGARRRVHRCLLHRHLRQVNPKFLVQRLHHGSQHGAATTAPAVRVDNIATCATRQQHMLAMCFHTPKAIRWPLAPGRLAIQGGA